jgi:hypothetical protein
MDILKMTVGECMKNAKVKALVEKHIPEISKFPVMLFAKKSCGELIKMGIKQGLFTQADADMMVAKINTELEKLV